MRLLTLGKKELVLPRAMQKNQNNSYYGNYSANPRFSNAQRTQYKYPLKQTQPISKKARFKRTKIIKKFDFFK